MYVGQNIRKTSATFVCIHIALLQVSIWQEPGDRVSQSGVNNPTYIFWLRLFFLPETPRVEHNGFCVTSLLDFKKLCFGVGTY